MGYIYIYIIISTKLFLISNKHYISDRYEITNTLLN